MDTQIYLPSKDRSFWLNDEPAGPLQYMAWGSRDFCAEPIPVSRHSGWTAVVILEGNPSLLFEPEAFTLSKGSFALIGPDCSTGWASKTSDNCRFILWIWSSLSPVSLCGTPRDGYRCQTITNRQSQSLKQLHALCHSEAIAPHATTPNSLKGAHIIFESLLQKIVESPATSDEDNNRIELARQWIDKNLDSKQAVTRLGDYLNLSQSSLYRMFQNHLKQSPKSYIHEMRMKRAHELLTNSDLSIKEIAFSLGYNHSNDFSRAFKSHFGQPCSQIERS